MNCRAIRKWMRTLSSRAWSKEGRVMATKAAAVSKEDQLKKLSKINTLRSALPIIGLVVVFFVFNALTHGGMWTSRNLILNQIYVTMISATGVFFIMTMGGLDFSQGSILGMASIAVRILLCEPQDQVLHCYDLYNVPLQRIHQIHGIQFAGSGFDVRV